MPSLRWGAATNAGRVRTENEDTFVAEPLVFAVADGMGGHQAGEVASALAASIVRDRFDGGAASEDAAAAVIAEANAAIYGAARANAAQTGMGTTLTALVVLTDRSDADAERLVLLNVGDSRTYRFRFGRLQRVTVDHSYVQELVATGHISMEEARTHPRRNIVTRALGIEPTVRADMWTLPIVRGDRFILCSDGLVDEVPDHEILDLVAAVEEPQALADQLVEMAIRHGGRDNVTVVVVDVLEGADPPDPTDEISFDPAWAEGIEEPATWADDAAAVPADGNEVLPEGFVTQPSAEAAGVTTAQMPVLPPTPTLPAPGAAIDVSATSGPVATAVAPAAAATGLSVEDSVTEKLKPPKRRRFTFGVFLFVLVLAAIIILTFTLVAVHARSGYFVGFDDDTVVIYKGQRDKVLWFEPTIVDRSTKRRQDLEPEMVAVIADRPTFDSAEDAARFIAEQVVPTTSTTVEESTTTTSQAPVTTTGETTPPTIAGP
jgi:PPM family protein phosphatase